MCTSCNCGTQTRTTQDVTIGTAPTTRESTTDTTAYTVVGMTCGHCVASVTEEVSALDGVRDVGVDLATGVLTFASDRPITREAIETAVHEAGYTLA